MAAGCSDDAGDSGGADLAGDPADMGVAEACRSDGQRVALTKRYGMQIALEVNVKVPADCSGDSCILDNDTTSLLLLLADVTQAERSVTFQAHPCHLDVPQVALQGQGMPTVLTASDALVQSVKVAPSTGMLDGDETCARFALPPFALVLGARLANPATDPIPVYSQARNPPVALCGNSPSTDCDGTMDTGCICDVDKDGKAAATVAASGVPGLPDVDQLYLALRTVVGQDATVFPPSPGQPTPGQRFKGTVTGLKLDQSPVGCRHAASGGTPPYDCNAGETNAAAHLNPRLSQSDSAPSTFVAMPVPDGETCAQLIADQRTLFRGQ